jgi:hypothetical protein
MQKTTRLRVAIDESVPDHLVKIARRAFKTGNDRFVVRLHAMGSSDYIQEMRQARCHFHLMVDNLWARNKPVTSLSQVRFFPIRRSEKCVKWMLMIGDSGRKYTGKRSRHWKGVRKVKADAVFQGLRAIVMGMEDKERRQWLKNFKGARNAAVRQGRV